MVTIFHSLVLCADISSFLFHRSRRPCFLIYQPASSAMWFSCEIGCKWIDDLASRVRIGRFKKCTSLVNEGRLLLYAIAAPLRYEYQAVIKYVGASAFRRWLDLSPKCESPLRLALPCRADPQNSARIAIHSARSASQPQAHTKATKT